MVQITPLRTILMTLAMLMGIAAHANVTFKFDASSIDAGKLRTNMESNTSALLTEITRAGNASGDLNLTSISMEPEARNRLAALWEAVRFVCDDDLNIGKCLSDFQGYQVRNIPVTILPRDNTYDGPLNRDLTLSFSRSGVITGVRFALESLEDASRFLTDAGGVTELSQRKEILKWIEDFRCYYNERDTAALNLIYSKDAIIITGSIMRPRKLKGNNEVGFRRADSPKVRYMVQDKESYMKHIAKIFDNNRYLNVEFDHISLMSHGSKDNIYGVTLHQTWKSSTYSDDGWLFLLWDFNDPDHPQIHVRTWQPNEVFTRDGGFDLNDFFIP